MQTRHITTSFLDNERLRQAFADKANSVGPWLEGQLTTVAQIGMGGRGSLEQAIQALQVPNLHFGTAKRLLQDVNSRAHTYKGSLDELERYNQEMQVEVAQFGSV